MFILINNKHNKANAFESLKDVQAYAIKINISDDISTYENLHAALLAKSYFLFSESQSEIALQEIYDWHDNCRCQGSRCGIYQAIKKNKSENEIVAIAYEIDAGLFDLDRSIYEEVVA